MSNNTSVFKPVLCGLAISLLLAGCGGGSDDRGDGTFRDLDPGTSDGGDNNQGGDPGDNTDPLYPDRVTATEFRAELDTAGSWQVQSSIDTSYSYDAPAGDGDINFVTGEVAVPSVSVAGAITKTDLFTISTANGVLSQDRCDHQVPTTLGNSSGINYNSFIKLTGSLDSFKPEDCNPGSEIYSQSEDGTLTVTTVCNGEPVGTTVLNRISNESALDRGWFTVSINNQPQTVVNEGVCGQLSATSLTFDVGLGSFTSTQSEINILAPYGSGFVELSFNLPSTLSTGEFIFGDEEGVDEGYLPTEDTTPTAGVRVTGIETVLLGGGSTSTEQVNFDYQYEVVSGNLTIESLSEGAVRANYDIELNLVESNIDVNLATTTLNLESFNLKGAFLLDLDSTSSIPNYQ